MAFTEQGVAMPCVVIHSWRAIQVNVQVTRAFVQLRYMIVDQVQNSNVKWMHIKNHKKSILSSTIERMSKHSEIKTSI